MKKPNLYGFYQSYHPLPLPLPLEEEEEESILCCVVHMLMGGIGPREMQDRPFPVSTSPNPGLEAATDCFSLFRCGLPLGPHILVLCLDLFRHSLHLLDLSPSPLLGLRLILCMGLRRRRRRRRRIQFELRSPHDYGRYRAPRNVG